MELSVGGANTVLGLALKTITCNTSGVYPGFFKGQLLVCEGFRINRAFPQNVSIQELEPPENCYIRNTQAMELQ